MNTTPCNFSARLEATRPGTWFVYYHDSAVGTVPGFSPSHWRVTYRSWLDEVGPAYSSVNRAMSLRAYPSAWEQAERQCEVHEFTTEHAAEVACARFNAMDERCLSYLNGVYLTANGTFTFSPDGQLTGSSIFVFHNSRAKAGFITKLAKMALSHYTGMPIAIGNEASPLSWPVRFLCRSTPEARAATVLTFLAVAPLLTLKLLATGELTVDNPMPYFLSLAPLLTLITTAMFGDRIVSWLRS